MNKNTADSDNQSVTSDCVDLKNESDRQLPSAKKSGSTRNGSVSIHMGEKDSNYIERLRTMSHQEILKWLEERNLGNVSKRVLSIALYNSRIINEVRKMS